MNQGSSSPWRVRDEKSLNEFPFGFLEVGDRILKELLADGHLRIRFVRGRRVGLGGANLVRPDMALFHSLSKALLIFSEGCEIQSFGHLLVDLDRIIIRQ